MKNVVIAFDVDGTLISTDGKDIYYRIVSMLDTIASLKNTKVVVWSARGADYAHAVTRRIDDDCGSDLCSKVNMFLAKGRKEVGGKTVYEPPIVPDIAIDDVHSCELGKLNLIVKNK